MRDPSSDTTFDCSKLEYSQLDTSNELPMEISDCEICAPVTGIQREAIVIEISDQPPLLNVEVVVNGKVNDADDESTHDDLNDVSE